MRIPDLDDAVLVGPDLHLDEAAGPVAGDLQLLLAVSMNLHRPAGLLGDAGTRHAPSIGGELAAEAAADVVAVHGHVVGRDAQRLGELARRCRETFCVER